MQISIGGNIMGLLKKLKSMIAGVAAGALVVTSFSSLPLGGDEKSFDVNAASAVTINTNKTYQRIRGFGGMNHPEWTGADLTAAQRQKAFGNGADELGFTILRIFVNPNSNQWNLAVPTAKYATEHGVTVFASPWEPPSNLAASGGTGGLQGKLHLPESNYAAYAEHLNNFGTYMKNNGVDLYSISVQNEPDYAEDWTAWTPAQTTNFIANYGDRITSTRLMSPESFQYGAWNNGKDYYKQILANPKAFENCDLFGTHFYGTPRDRMDFPDLENCGKEIWMTEVYVPNSEANSNERWPEGVQVAENIHNGLVVGNMSAYVWWYIRRSYGPMNEDGTISKRGYAMAQYSKWVRPGDVRIDATEQPDTNILVSAYKHSDTQIEVVAINKGNSEITQQFNVSGRTITNVDRYRTSANENIAPTKGMEASGSTFYSQLPANSVSTYVITLESDGKPLPDYPDGPVTPEPITPDSNGYYYHDTFEGDTFDWTGRGDASVTLSGRIPYADKEALLVQDRTSSWHGAQKKLDPTTFKAGEEYSFSVIAATSGTGTHNMMLSLQYTDPSGETQYAHIAQAVSVGENYVQLADTNFKLPQGSNFILYVETEDGTDNFYIDEAIIAVKGTKIDGPAELKFILGDVNCDGRVDAFDMVAARKGLINGLSGAAALAGDVNGDGKYTIADAVQINEYLLGKIKAFVKGENSGDNNNNNNNNNDSNVVPTIKMSDYTAKVQQNNLVENEPNDSKQEKNGVKYGDIKSGTYFSTVCNRNKPYNILLPANYDSSKKYPVLYVMHGYWENQDRMIKTGNGTMYTRQIIGNAIAEGQAKDMIVVFPYIYSSKTQENCTAMDDANNAAYDNFVNELVVDLMPHIESTYSVKTGKENTAITGFSMGGRESLNVGHQYADKFGYIGAICPAPGTSGNFKWASEEAAPYLVFITAGGNDEVVWTTPNGYHENYTKNNVPHVWHYVNNGYHGDNSIHAHLYNFVRNIFYTEDWS